jgi:hypothetical protein
MSFIFLIYRFYFTTLKIQIFDLILKANITRLELFRCD